MSGSRCVLLRTNHCFTWSWQCISSGNFCVELWAFSLSFGHRHGLSNFYITMFYMPLLYSMKLSIVRSSASFFFLYHKRCWWELNAAGPFFFFPISLYWTLYNTISGQRLSSIGRNRSISWIYKIANEFSFSCVNIYYRLQQARNVAGNEHQFMLVSLIRSWTV